MADRIKIADFDLDLTGVLKEAAAYREEIDKLKAGLKAMRKDENTTSEALVNQETKIKSLNNEYKKRLDVLQNSRDSQQQEIKRADQLTTALDHQGKTIRELRQNNKALNKLKLDAPTGSKELTEINNKLDLNNAKLKDNADAYTKQKIGIGDYTGGIERAIPGLSQLMVVLNGTKESLIAMRAATKASQAGFTGMIKVSKLLKIALISTGIGAIVVALGFLVTYLASTQEGMDKITAVTRPLQAVFQSLLGVVQKVGKVLFDAASKPKEAFASLKKYFDDNIMPLFTSTRKILDGIMSRDYSKIFEGITDFKDAAGNLVDKVKDAVKETAAFIADAAAKGTMVDALTKSIEQAEIDIIGYRATTNLQLKEQENIAKDRNKTEAERTAAVKEQERLAKSLVQRENQILDMEIGRLRIKQSLNDTSRDENKELEELLAKRVDNEQRITDIARRNLGVVNQLQNEARTARKQASDKRLKQADEASKAKIKAMEVELETFQLLNKSKLDSEKEVNKKIYEDQLSLLEKKAVQEKMSTAELNLEKLKLKQEYDNQIAEIDLATEENNKAIEEARKTEEALQQEFEFQQKILRLREQGETEFEIQREINNRNYEQQQIDLEQKFQDELITYGEYARQKTNIEQQQADATEKIKEAEKQANINAAMQTIDAVASVVDSASAAGKSISLAKAGYAVFEAISKANAVGFPQNIPLMASAAAIGYKAIKNIQTVKIPSAKGSGSVSGGGAPKLPPMSAGLRPQSNMETNPTVSNQIGNRLDTNSMSNQMSEGVKAGVKEGMIELSDNKRIQSKNTY